MPIFELPEDVVFPDPRLANPDGILAVGGDLSPERLVLAYQNGIFPWYSSNEPIIWWSPDPRFVLYPENLRITKSLQKTLNKEIFEVTFDTAFEKVIDHCQQIDRRGQRGTWITDDMQGAYIELHKLGYAHSVEVWQEKELVGGLYGVSLGKCYFGESMFSLVSDASKVGFVTLLEMLIERDFKLIDCQVYTGHLERFGAMEIDRNVFLEDLAKFTEEEDWVGSWSGL